MTVYVDDVRHQLGRMVFCHMWADTETELLEMADRIGVDRMWIQGHPKLSFGKHRKASWVHFDITLSKKKIALQSGAILTDMYGPVEHVATLDLKLARKNGDRRGIEIAARKLSMVASVRGKRAKLWKDTK